MPEQVRLDRFVPPKIVEDNEVKPDEEEMKPVEDIKRVSTENQEGKDDPDPPQVGEQVVVEVEDNTLYNIADVQVVAEPAYDLNEYLSNNIEYPDMEKEAGVSGDVKVRFVVEKDGSITNVEVVTHVSPGLDEEALRVMKKMKPWKPAQQNGRAVRLSFTKKISFTLE